MTSLALTISFLKLSMAAPVCRVICEFSISSIGIHAIEHPHSSKASPVFGFMQLIFKNEAHSNCLPGSKLFSGH